MGTPRADRTTRYLKLCVPNTNLYGVMQMIYLDIIKDVGSSQVHMAHAFTKGFEGARDCTYPTGLAVFIPM
jgi:hypothetical protein